MATRKYIPIIDYLKALAIVMVTTTHFFSFEEKDFPFFIYVVQMGMPLFMLLIGYNTAMSNDRHDVNTFSALYAPKRLAKQFGGIMPSYLLMFAIEAVASGALVAQLPWQEWLYSFFTGGLQGGSHGGYFFAIYWQFLLVAPILYLLVKRYPTASLIGALALNVLYEYAVGALEIPRLLNRVLFMRYLFIAVFGLYFYLWRHRVKLWAIGLAACFSLWYITALEFFDMTWPFGIYWQNTNVYASFYYIAIAVFAFHCFENKCLPKGLHEVAHQVGSATWQIYLTQMLYFRLQLNAPIADFPLWVQIPIGVALCCMVGVGWNYAERRGRKWWRARKARKTDAV